MKVESKIGLKIEKVIVNESCVVNISRIILYLFHV